MGIWIVKLIASLVLPIGLAVVLLLLAAVAVLRGRTRLGAGMVVLVAVALWLVSTQRVAGALMERVEDRYPPVPVGRSPTADAILVLSGGVRPARAPGLRADAGPSAERVIHAARLYRAGKAPVVIASGGRHDRRPGVAPDAEAMADLLVELGVPRDAILLEARSRTTHENCALTKPILDQHHIHSVLLVTSAIHMRRALATCRSAGIDAAPSPTDFEAPSRPTGGIMSWRPDSGALDRSSRTIWEILGFTYYRSRGWIRSPRTVASRQVVLPPQSKVQ